MDDASVMYGMGASKAGTTWLYRYLRAHPDCHFRRVKEIHYWNNAETGRFGWRAKALARHADQRRLRLATADETRAAAIRADLADMDDWQTTFARGGAGADAYLAYLSRGRTGQRLVGDVTPAYATLSVETLCKMAALAPVTRFVYILRDPLERLWSNIRMAAKRAAAAGGDLADHAHALTEKVLSGDHAGVEARADYAGSITRIDAAVPPSSRLYLFFETLFLPETVATLCRFLGIAPVGAKPQVVHRGARLVLDPAHRARARALLQPQYEFVTSFFGDQTPESWRVSMAEG